jgi:hypothetical protein
MGGEACPRLRRGLKKTMQPKIGDEFRFTKYHPLTWKVYRVDSYNLFARQERDEGRAGKDFAMSLSYVDSLYWIKWKTGEEAADPPMLKSKIIKATLELVAEAWIEDRDEDFSDRLRRKAKEL